VLGPRKFSDSVDHRWRADAGDLLLADEPTSSLDPKTSVEIMELISRRASESIPAIVNIHNVEQAGRYAARFIGLAESSLVAFLSARIG
jgi:ABC-type phosphate/phosphonate transport system ATPase subunit